MPNILKNNAYHILGLDTSATQKDIQKHAKEILKLLQIDDVPEYDIDLGVFEDFRTENSVKEALQKLSSPKKQIKDNFFWFRIEDDIDQKAVSGICKENPKDAINAWGKSMEGETAKALFHKKNLAILYCILLFKEDDKHYLKESLRLWNELIKSTKFWNTYFKIYKHNDELDTDQKVLTEFQSQAPLFLSDLYTEIADARGDGGYIAEFTKVFNIRGEKTEKAVMAPIFQKITEAVTQLESMKVSEDGVFDQEEADQIKQHIKTIEDCSNKLIDLGLYNDSQSKLIRDRAASAIRTIVLDIHNNLDELSKAEQLLKIAMEFVGTSGMKNKLKQDLLQFEENKKFINAIAPIMKLMNDKQFPEALALIDQKKSESDDLEFRNALDNKKKEAVTMYAILEFINAKKLFEDGKHNDARPGLEKSASIVYEQIDLYDVNKDVIDSWLDLIKTNVKALTAENADEIDEVHKKMLNKIDEAFDERWEQLAIKVLINAYYYVGVGDVLKAKRTENTQSSVIGWILFIIISIILAAIFGN